MLCDCSGVAPLPLLLHRPSALCQLFQVLPPTSCLHLLGIPVPTACPVIKQQLLRARDRPVSTKTTGPSPWVLAPALPSCHPAAGSLVSFPSPAPHLGITASSPTLLPQHQGLHRQSIAPYTPAWWEMAESTRPIPFWQLAFQT